MSLKRIYTYEIPINAYIQEVNLNYVLTLTYRTNIYYGNILPESVIKKLVSDIGMDNQIRIIYLKSRLVGIDVEDLYQ